MRGWHRIARSLVLGASLLALPLPVAAQVARVGETFAAIATPDLKRRPDVAYDPVNRVYLVVSGANVLWGRFVGADGTLLGDPFPIPQAPGTQQAPRVAYGRNVDNGQGGFLVTWLDWRGGNLSNVYGRLVAYRAGGQPAFLSAEILIAAPAGGAHSELGMPAVAYATGSGLFLVTWMQFGGLDIRAQRVSAAGQLVGSEIPVTAEAFWSGDPDVTYNAGRDEFLVVYLWEPAPGVVLVTGRRIAASTGAAGTPFEITRASAIWIPRVRSDGGDGYLAAWFQFVGGTPVFYGRQVTGEGQVGAVQALAAGYSSYDALGLDYNPTTGTYFMAFHGTTADDMGMQISRALVPDPIFQVTNSGGTGNFNPRVAAATDRGEWLVVTARSFASIVGQRVGTGAVVPPPPGPTPPPSPPPPPTPVTIDLSSSAAPNGSWFFAEGANGGAAGFETYYLIENPNGVPVDVTMYVAREDGVAVRQDLGTVPPLSRVTRSLAGFAAGGYSVVIQSRTPGFDVFAERSMYWGPGWAGGAASVAEKTPRTEWYFAEGSLKNGFFQNYFLVFNPSSTQEASVTFTFYPGSDCATRRDPVTRSGSIVRQGRWTFSANNVPELANCDFSTKVSSTVPVVAERSMYWGPNWEGGTTSFGVAGPAPEWHFAEGAAFPDFDTYLLVYNPNAQTERVEITFMGVSGRLAVVYRDVPGNFRATVWLPEYVGRSAGAVAIKVRSVSGAPIICEESIYWGSTPAGWVEGTNAMGVTAPAPVWYLPEGITRSGFDTFVLVSNPNTFPVRVRLWPILETGGMLAPKDVDVAAEGRATIWVNHELPVVSSSTFSIKVETLTPGAGVVVEHAIYWGRHPTLYWLGGSASFGIPRSQ